MSGLIGKKIGMTSIFDENGKNIPCTVIEVGPVLLPKSELRRLMGMRPFNLVSMTRRLLLKLPRGTLKKQEPLQNAKSPNLKVLMRKLN